MKRSLIVIFIVFLVFNISFISYAQIKEVSVGVDRGDIVASGRYQLSPNYELFMEYIQGRPLGVGLYYSERPWKIDIEDMATYWRIAGRLDGFGSLGLRGQKGTGKLIADANIRTGDFRIYGRVGTETEGLSGNLTGQYTWLGGITTLRWRDINKENDIQEIFLNHVLRQDEYSLRGAGIWRIDQELGQMQRNLVFDYELKKEDHTVSVKAQSNQYGSEKSLIGQGIEALWTPPFDWLRLGVGYFSEDETGVGTERYRILARYTYSYPINSITLGVQASGEGFFYGTGDRRGELSLGSFAATGWDTGDLELRLTNIRRVGDTPFHFDYNPHRRELLAQMDIEQRFGSVLTNLSTSYDLFQEEWRKMWGDFHIQYRLGDMLSTLSSSYDFLDRSWQEIHGSVQTTLWDDLFFRFTASYDMEEEPKLDDTVFISEFRYAGDVSLEARVNMNYEFNPLIVRGKVEVASEDSTRTLEVRYDAEEGQFDTVTGSWSTSELGRVSIQYRPVRPSIMVTYQPLAW